MYRQVDVKRLFALIVVLISLLPLLLNVLAIDFSSLSFDVHTQANLVFTTEKDKAFYALSDALHHLLLGGVRLALPP